jgi:hypothetical protein
MIQMPSATKLLEEMKNALPLYCCSKKRNTASLAAQGVTLSDTMRLEVDSVFDLGEAGGIMCAIKYPKSNKVLTMSLTGLGFRDNGSIDEKIFAYQEARIEWLKQEEQRDILGRDAPCPCNSRKKYRHCCGKK